MQNICILGGTCPCSTADISDYVAILKMLLWINYFLYNYMTKQIFEQNSVPEIILYLKIDIMLPPSKYF